MTILLTAIFARLGAHFRLEKRFLLMEKLEKLLNSLPDVEAILSDRKCLSVDTLSENAKLDVT
jgi:hypothetical protein